MRKTTIRLTDDAWDLIATEAQDAGVSAAQFIREAAVARAVFRNAARDAADRSELSAELERVFAIVRPELAAAGGDVLSA